MSSEIRSRLHPLSLPFSLLSHLRGFLVPIVLIVAFSEELDWEAWTILLLVPVMLFEAWHYWSLRYWLTADELIVTEGVLFREERHIPLARIQTVDSTQNLAQRWCGVVEVRVETAGSSKPEAHLKVLSVAARDQLRHEIFAGGRMSGRVTAAALDSVVDGAEPGGLPGIQAPDDEGEELMRVGPGELALLGLNLGRGLALLGLFFGLTAQMGLFDEIQLGRLLDSVRQMSSGLAEGGVWLELLAELTLAAILIFLVFALSVGSVWVRLFDFRLERRGDEFRTQCGLFTRHATTIPKGRVQFISIQSPLTLRLFGRSLVKVRTAGGLAEGDKAAATRQWLTPVMRDGEVPSLIRELVPAFEPRAIDWQPVAPRAKTRLMRKAALLALAINVIPALNWSTWGVYVLPLSLPGLLVLLVAMAYLRAERLAWAETPEAFFVRDGVLTHRVALVPRNRIQTVSLSASPFDRRWRMARLFLDTAGSNIGHRAEVPYMQHETARRLADDLVAEAELSAH